MLVPIIVPGKIMPVANSEHDCICLSRPVRLYFRKMKLFWNVQTGDTVEEGQVICVGEVEKKTLEINAPCKGVMKEISVGDGKEVGAEDTIGYVEKDN